MYNRGMTTNQATQLKTYRLPPRFYYDHISRDLPETGVSTKLRGSTAHTLLVEMDASAYADLLSDADYYSEGSQFDPPLPGLVRSAKATVEALRQQGPPDGN